MLPDLIEIEADFAESGGAGCGAALLTHTLKLIASEPLATGATVLRLAFVAEQALAITRDDLFQLVSKGVRG
ncbi:hypothetical protein [Rhodopseudomonas sp. BR0G17]|uniref:hypothetical protein n=1 Tax=Rhodopseudomonas sp. BR0G17 TaxID=2269368 RepID=UPI0013DFAE48|nr:hypothetical protein [Rhodopseudomonas sp. BR0G17]